MAEELVPSLAAELEHPAPSRRRVAAALLHDFARRTAADLAPLTITLLRGLLAAFTDTDKVGRRGWHCCY